MDAETRQGSPDTLLVVDDEPLITELFDKFMSRRGFRVLTAGGGGEALTILEAEPDSVRLVLTDVTMPVMDGIALAKEMLRRHPAIPVMLATGHDAGMELAAGLSNVVSVVRKPYQNRVLAEQIRELLDGGRASG